MSAWSDLSKKVGLQQPFHIEWPSVARVKAAEARGDGYSLLYWNRFLPSPDTPERIEVINQVVASLSHYRAQLEGQENGSY